MDVEQFDQLESQVRQEFDLPGNVDLECSFLKRFEKS